MTARGELPDVEITDRGAKVSTLDNSVPVQVSPLAELVYSMLPRPKITEILDEVNSLTTFIRHFSHIKHDINHPNTRLLLTTILADGINLGLTKMAEACPDTSAGICVLSTNSGAPRQVAVYQRESGSIPGSSVADIHDQPEPERDRDSLA